MGGGWRPAGPGPGRPSSDPAEEVAVVALAKRELLLRVHRHRLRRDDLEDCFSQSTLELIAHARAGGTFSSRLHIARAIELRFISRIRDRRRALSGRSSIEAAIEQAACLGEEQGREVELLDQRPTVEVFVLLKEELCEIARLFRRLTPDQRLVLGSQLAGASPAEFCDRHDWTREKYRKVAQRARARLRLMVASAERAETAVPDPGPGSEEHTGPTYANSPPT